jgi:hypothetical protein
LTEKQFRNTLEGNEESVVYAAKGIVEKNKENDDPNAPQQGRGQNEPVRII